MPALIQLEIGISTNLYFPAMGTAGLLLLAVKGYKRVPAPPPRITAIVLFAADLLISLIYSLTEYDSKITVSSCTDQHISEHCFPS